MSYRFLRIATLLLLLAALFLPFQGSATAQEKIPAEIDFQVPASVLESVGEGELVELLYQTLMWKGGELLAYAQAVDELTTPLMGDVRQVLGPQSSLPDIAGTRRDLETALDAVGQSTTLAEARENANAVLAVMRTAKENLLALPAQFEPLKVSLQRQGADLEATVTREMERQAADLENRLRAELEESAKARVQELKASLGQQANDLAASLVAQAGRSADIATIRQQVGAFVAERMLGLQAELTDELAAAADEAEARARATMDQYMLDAFGDQVTTMERIRDGFQGIDQRIQTLAESKIDRIVPAARRAAIETKAEIIRRVVDQEFDRAEAIVRSNEDALNRARAEGREVPDVNTLLGQLAADKESLVASLVEAESDAEIQEAVASYRAGWEARDRELERLRFEGGKEIIEAVMAELESTDVEAKLRTALDTVAAGIEALEQQAARGQALDSGDSRKLRKLRLLVPQLGQALDLIDEVKRAQATDPIDDLLALKDRLQSKLEAVQRTASEESLQTGTGIFFEAENETATRLSPRGTVTRKEVNLPAGWRPVQSGNGDWVLMWQGEALIYEFEVAEAGEFVLWIRDYSDNKHPPGARTIGVSIDGQFLGTFAENMVRAAYPPGVLAWQATAKALLAPGQHVLEVEKTRTTSAAALLDAFYLTADPNDNPQAFAGP